MLDASLEIELASLLAPPLGPNSTKQPNQICAEDFSGENGANCQKGSSHQILCASLPQVSLQSEKLKSEDCHDRFLINAKSFSDENKVRQ